MTLYRRQMSFVLLLTVLGGPGGRADSGPTADRLAPRAIPGAVRLYFTERGANYLSRNLLGILQDREQLDPYQGQFDLLTHQSREAVPLDKLIENHAEAGQFLATFRSFANKYVRCFKEIKPSSRVDQLSCDEKNDDFRVKDPQFALALRNFTYDIDYARFSLQPVAGASGNQGARFRLATTITKLQLAADDIQVTDQQNVWVGFGFNLPRIHLAKNSPAIELLIDFEARVQKDGRVKIVVHDMRANFELTRLQVRYKSLLNPEIDILISTPDGRRFMARVDSGPLRSQFERERPQLINQGKQMLDVLFNKIAPRSINEFFQNQALDPLGFLEELDGINSEKNSCVLAGKRLVNVGGQALPLAARSATADCRERGPFVLGLQLDSLGHAPLSAREARREQTLSLGFAGFIEDPNQSNSSHLDDEKQARVGPDVSGLDPSSFDVAVTLDRGMANRALQLEFERGTFTNLEFAENAARPKDPSGPVIRLPHLGRSCIVLPASEPPRSRPRDDEKIVRLSFVTAPEIVLDVPESNIVGSFAPLQARGEIAVESDSMWTASTVRVRTALNGQIRPSRFCDSKGRELHDLVLTGFDIANTRVADESYSWVSYTIGIVWDGVLGQVQSLLEDLQRRWTAQLRDGRPETLGRVRVSRKILGRQMDVFRMKTDKNGHIVLFYNFRDEKDGQKHVNP